MSVSDHQDREAKVLESLQRGIADAAAGRVVVMGSFIDVELLRELCEKATEGDWWADIVEGTSCPNLVSSYLKIENDPNIIGRSYDIGCMRTPEDATFIAAARTAIPDLLDRLERAEAERNEWKQRFENAWHEMRVMVEAGPEAERDRYRAALEGLVGALGAMTVTTGGRDAVVVGVIPDTVKEAWSRARAALGVEGEGT